MLCNMNQGMYCLWLISGYGGLSLSIEGPSKADIECQDNEDGSCRVTYRPTEPGNYVVNVKFADEHVPGTVCSFNGVALWYSINSFTHFSVLDAPVQFAVDNVECLKTKLNRCIIAPSELEALAMDRADWRSSCKSAVEKFEIRCIQELESKRDLRKSGPPPTSNYECQICHRMCHSRIGLLAHHKSHS